MNYANRLDVGNVDMYFYRNKGTKHPNLIVACKSIYINTYSVNIIDLDTGILIYRHDCFCLWESQVMSFFNYNTHHLITLSCQGMKVMSLDDTTSTSIIKDNRGRSLKLHTLSTCKYL